MSQGQQKEFLPWQVNHKTASSARNSSSTYRRKNSFNSVLADRLFPTNNGGWGRLQSLEGIDVSLPLVPCLLPQHFVPCHKTQLIALSLKKDKKTTQWHLFMLNLKILIRLPTHMRTLGVRCLWKFSQSVQHLHEIVISVPRISLITRYSSPAHRLFQDSYAQHVNEQACMFLPCCHRALMIKHSVSRFLFWRQEGCKVDGA